nr:glycosyltransferase family 2 protein [Haloferula sp. BvORR071]
MLHPSPRRITQPRVSVIVPAYNAEKWLPATLDSVCSQSLREIEILVVDDGSTDSTHEIAAAFAARDPRVILIRQDNAGVGAARNRAIAAARGDYIAPLDADDLWYPEKLARQVDCMEAGGDAMGFAYCWSEKIDAAGRVVTGAFPSDSRGSVLADLLIRNFVGNASVPIFRATALKECGAYLTRDEQHGMQGCEDWELLLRIAEKYQVGLVAETLVMYRLAPGCMSMDARSMGESYECAMTQVRQRNPDLAPELFRTSAANFYSYLVAKSCNAQDPSGCLWALGKALRADPMLIASRRMRRMGLKSLAELAIIKLRGLRDRKRSRPIPQGKGKKEDALLKHRPAGPLL